MEPKSDPVQAVRQSIAKVMKAGFVVCWILMAVGVIALAVAGHLSPGALATFTAALACLAGVFVVLYQSAGKWARDPRYSLRGKGLALLFALLIASLLMIFWSTSL
jgi:multisubunit Na+/H+ antiporter MnhB subunit